VLETSLFRVADFRALAACAFLNSIGMMAETVTLGWLALELTNSPFLVGVAMAARMLPLFFVGVPAGVLADRFPRHRLLMLTGAGQAATSATLGILTQVGVVTLGHLLLVTLAAGVFRGLEHAARQSYTHDVVGAGALVNGFAILGVGMRFGWFLGSLGAGAVIAHRGSGAAYLAVAIAYLAGSAALLWTSAPARPRPAATASVWRSVTAFVGVVRTNPTVLVLMTLTAGAEILGFSHQALLPSLARDVLHVGPEGLGTLNAARSAGGVMALIAASARSSTLGGGGPFIAALVIFGASLLGLGVAPHVVDLAGVVVVLVVVNAAGALADLLAQSLLQLSVPGNLRGRAGGAWVVAIGLAPLGQLQIGALASLFGVSAALGASGLALLALAVVAAALFPGVRRL